MVLSSPRFVVLTILAGLGFALGAGAASVPEGLDSLVPRDGDFDATLVRPGADLSEYREIALEPVELEFREVEVESEPVLGSMISKRSNRIGTPRRKDVKRTRQAFDEVLLEELRRNDDLELVDTSGPGRLIVRPSVVDIISRELLEAAGHTLDPEGPPIVRGTIVFDLIDAESGALQARLSERREIEMRTGEERFEAVARWARGAVTDLLEELGKDAGEPG